MEHTDRHKAYIREERIVGTRNTQNRMVCRIWGYCPPHFAAASSRPRNKGIGNASRACKNYAKCNLCRSTSLRWSVLASRSRTKSGTWLRSECAPVDLKSGRIRLSRYSCAHNMEDSRRATRGHLRCLRSTYSVHFAQK